LHKALARTSLKVQYLPHPELKLTTETFNLFYRFIIKLFFSYINKIPLFSQSCFGGMMNDVKSNKGHLKIFMTDATNTPIDTPRSEKTGVLIDNAGVVSTRT
jgi:hypothetical protein